MAIYRLKFYERNRLVETMFFDRTKDCLNKSQKFVAEWFQHDGAWVQLDVATRPSSEPALYLVRQATSLQDWQQKLQEIQTGVH